MSQLIGAPQGRPRIVALALVGTVLTGVPRSPAADRPRGRGALGLRIRDDARIPQAHPRFGDPECGDHQQ